MIVANAETTTTKFPIIDKPVSYRIVATTEPNQAEFGDMAFFKQLEEKTNVKVVFTADKRCYYRFEQIL